LGFPGEISRRVRGPDGQDVAGAGDEGAGGDQPLEAVPPLPPEEVGPPPRWDLFGPLPWPRAGAGGGGQDGVLAASLGSLYPPPPLGSWLQPTRQVQGIRPTSQTAKSARTEAGFGLELGLGLGINLRVQAKPGTNSPGSQIMVEQQANSVSTKKGFHLP